MDDFFSLYGDKSHYSVSPRGLVVTDDGHAIGVHATGLFTNTPTIASLLAGDPGVPAEDWGQSYSGITPFRNLHSRICTCKSYIKPKTNKLMKASAWTFDVNTNSTDYKDLADSMFVGNFRLMPGNSDNSSYFNVEYRLSKMTPGPHIQGSCS